MEKTKAFLEAFHISEERKKHLRQDGSTCVQDKANKKQIRINVDTKLKSTTQTLP